MTATIHQLPVNPPARPAETPEQECARLLSMLEAELAEGLACVQDDAVRRIYGTSAP